MSCDIPRPLWRDRWKAHASRSTSKVTAATRCIWVRMATRDPTFAYSSAPRTARRSCCALPVWSNRQRRFRTPSPTTRLLSLQTSISASHWNLKQVRQLCMAKHVAFSCGGPHAGRGPYGVRGLSCSLTSCAATAARLLTEMPS
jgi:hypothetical protein